MNPELQKLLDDLVELDSDVAEAIELAYALCEAEMSGGSAEALERLLKRKIENLVEDAQAYSKVWDANNDCVCDVTAPDLSDSTPSEDEWADPWDSDDDYPEDADYSEDDDDDDEEKVEEKVDELSEKLRLDVDDAAPLELAVAIVLATNDDEGRQNQLLSELAERGKNEAHLRLLIEDL